MEVIDLDVLRLPPKMIRLGNKEIDVSFIPCGITFKIDTLIAELNKYSLDELKFDEKELLLSNEEQSKIRGERSAKIKSAFELSLELCATFCEYKYPEMNVDWFKNNSDAIQIQAFTSAIKTALAHSYSGVTKDLKN